MSNNVLVLNERSNNEKINSVREISEMISAIKNDVFDDKEYLLDKYHEYAQAIQQGQPKAHLFESESAFNKAKNGKFKNRAYKEKALYWGVNDDPVDFLKASLDQIEFQLEQVKKKKASVIYQEPTNFQKQIMDLSIGKDGMSFEDESEMESFGIEWYDYCEWSLNHQKEAIIKHLRDEITFTQEEFIKSEMKIEIGKLLLKAGEKRQAIMEQASIINKNKNESRLNK